MKIRSKVLSTGWLVCIITLFFSGLSFGQSGNTIVIQTATGGVRVKNFYRSARKAGDLYDLTPSYAEDSITYDPGTQTFELTFSMSSGDWSDFVRNRVRAQNKLLTVLGITKSEACKLNVKVHPINRYVDFAPKFYESSFCTSPQTAPKQRTSTPDDGFRMFFASFKRAVLARDRASIRNIMSSSFFWALIEVVSRDEALRFIDEYKYWGRLRIAMNRNPVVCKRPYCGFGNPVSFYSGYRLGDRRLGDLLFVRDGSGEWKWKGLLGD